MRLKGFVKLVDLDADNLRARKALEAFLERHTIEYRDQDRWAEGHVRYFVRPADLCCALAVLEAIRDRAQRRAVERIGE